MKKEELIRIFRKYSYNVENQAGDHLLVVDADSWHAIAFEIEEHINKPREFKELSCNEQKADLLISVICLVLVLFALSLITIVLLS